MRICRFWAYMAISHLTTLFRRDARRCQENLGIKFNSRVRHSLPEAQRLWQEAIIKQTIRVRNGESDCVCTVDGCHSDHYHDLWPDRGGNDYPRIFFGI